MSQQPYLSALIAACVAGLGYFTPYAGAALEPVNDPLTGYNGHTAQEAVSGGNANQPSFATSNGFQFAYIWNGSNSGSWQNVLFTIAGASFGNQNNSGSGFNGRNLVETTESDYNAGSFKAYISITNPGSSPLSNAASGDAYAFFGLGNGNLGSYGVPDWNGGANANTTGYGSTAGLQLDTANGFIQDLKGANNGGFGASGNLANTAGPIALELSYNASSNTLQYFAETNYSGGSSYVSFAPTYSSDLISTVGYYNGTSNTGRIYFGADQGTNFSNFVVVVPEPTSLSLSILGIGGSLMIRRPKRH